MIIGSPDVLMITSFCKAAFSLNIIVILSGIYLGLITAPNLLPTLCDNYVEEWHIGSHVTSLKIWKFQKKYVNYSVHLLDSLHRI